MLTWMSIILILKNLQNDEYTGLEHNITAKIHSNAQTLDTFGFKGVHLKRMTAIPTKKGRKH